MILSLLISANALLLILLLVFVFKKSKAPESNSIGFQSAIHEKFADASRETRELFSENRKENSNSFIGFQDSLLKRINENTILQKEQLNQFSKLLKDLNDDLQFSQKQFMEETNQKQSQLLDLMNDRFQRFEERLQKESKVNREDFAFGIKNINEELRVRFGDLNQQQLDQNKLALDQIKSLKENVDSSLKSIREDNSSQLEKMRQTVDEKLQSTLEKRLGESFKLVSDRLELVHKGLGEMQTLASGVGDLKKVLTNVKTRGVLGEYQLGNILEQILTSEQYAKNVQTKKGSQAHVEFAIKLPGKTDDKNVWLPIDSKFPIENYQLLLEAYEEGDKDKIDSVQKLLLRSIDGFAKDISSKYIDPPHTTDFAIMFLPVESLYAEVLRHAGVFEKLQRDYKITITGPTTLSALLSSLNMGFRTLAVQKRSSEVWDVLKAVKQEFGNFAEHLDKVQKHLNTASTSLETLSSTRTNAINRKLRNIQTLDMSNEQNILDLPKNEK
ncbi:MULTISPECIES: DNA recombination protein RmuC [unclassified Lentimicrobium]|uniref:DNA recombination protein RmuC n=1 Tax=unclassified Lentimicrobium TaxID=2677434 RepID=UPI001551C78A|nr:MULTISPECIES: DNA recombination protein RmuC [unclassified Lentimicrobium]NPD46204.1 DNA recombination protein RmuC [Lentimicrobium sp. S6]NPD86750.1 DNA recombination protein RmuC [Lentimicrobium sp. L6]